MPKHIFFPWSKYRHTLSKGYRLYQKKKNTLSEGKALSFYQQLQSLQQALQHRKKLETKQMGKKLIHMMESVFPKSPLERAFHFILTLCIALGLTLLIRQLWFELYEIPTGSMRPTLKEKDRLIVSKTTFGINTPFTADHLLFSPQEVRRSGIAIFTAEGLDVKDPNTRYFYLFPGKKQYIKRMIGKPGDTLYFYGGLIYGMDSEGHDISKELQLERLSYVDHIPFLQFEGRVLTPSAPNAQGVFSPVLIKQTNEPIAQLQALPHGAVQGSLLPPFKDTLQDYFSLWGIENFGMVRLLSKEQAIKWAKLDTHLKDTRYYLEITHHPSIKNLHIERDMRGQPRPSLGTRSSLLPLDETHMRSLFQHLYTVRFVVQGERAYPYGYPKAFLQSPFLPTLSGVPDGTYEFYEGKAYKISFQGWSFALPDDHPLYQATPERIQLLFNLGMEFDTRFSPKSSSSPFQPMRYVYFRHGDLYLMGAPLFFQGDADLLQFQEQEKAKQAKDPLYPPFLDQGPPLLADGTLDLELLHKAGLVVPERHYFMLGDNHAVSADSRDFGFVPEENLKGAPDFVFWPPGSRFGPPNQPPYPWFVPSRIIIWVLAFSSIGGALYWQRKRQHVPPL